MQSFGKNFAPSMEGEGGEEEQEEEEEEEEKRTKLCKIVENQGNEMLRYRDVYHAECAVQLLQR